MTDPRPLLEPLRALHDRIRDRVVAACEQATADELSAVAAEEAGDTIYRIDRVGEEVLIAGMDAISRSQPLLLIAEGLPEAGVALPAGTPPEDCRWRVIVDPIDGTRGLMYQKRPGWILTGVAPNRGEHTSLRDVVLAVQTEIPLINQHLSDQVHALRGGGALATRRNRFSGESWSIPLRPSAAHGLEHGFATVVRFFPGARDVLAAVDDELVEAVVGPPTAGKAACFEDQYACTGGQLYALMSGRDRFIADLRPLMEDVRRERGLPRGLSCHPYDLCTALIAEEAGVVVTGPSGAELDVALDLESDVAWVGYANQALRARVEPELQRILSRRGLLAADPGARGGASPGPAGGG